MNIHKQNIEMYSNKKSVGYYVSLGNLKDIEKIILNKYLKGKVLDLGCGGGRTTKHIYDRGFKVVGVDNVKEMIVKARNKYPKIDFRVGDACDLKFKENEFDSVLFSFNGIDYIYPEKNRIRALKEIEKVLKPGGLLIYSSHNSLNLLFRFRPKFIIRNLKKRTLLSRYKIDKDFFGEFHTYYGSPGKQKKLVEENTSLKFVKTLRNGLRDVFPHYIFKKL